MSDARNDSLRRIPPVGDVLRHPDVAAVVPAAGRTFVVELVRQEIDRLRQSPRDGTRNELTERLAASVRSRWNEARVQRLDRVVNATGVVLHTGLGRAPLSPRAVEAVRSAAEACNLELDLATGQRRSRGHQLLDQWRCLTGCEDAFVVNNNAAATLLVLAAHCAGREVVISRGQLVEIGGSYRLPDVFALSGAVLREVGTTNRTRTSDYREAVNDRTAAILRVHPSNYSIQGFTEMPEIDELVPIAREHGVLCIDDVGSGCLVDTADLGLPSEPTFERSLAAGADLVLGSGDKLLGGPQAGIVLGRAAAVEPLRQHPFARTVRADKLALAALSGTLDAYLVGDSLDEVPVLALLGQSVESLSERAETLRQGIRLDAAQGWTIGVREGVSPVGGGSLPGGRLPTAALVLQHVDHSADELARGLRTGEPRVVPRVQDDAVLLDLRSVPPADDERLLRAVNALGSRS